MSDVVHKGPCVDSYIKGTCVEPTTMVSTCSACGEEVGRTYFGYNSHSYSYTKTENGKEIYVCTVCSNIKEVIVDNTETKNTSTKEESTGSSTTEKADSSQSSSQEKTTETSKTSNTELGSVTSGGSKSASISIAKYSWSGLKIVQKANSKKYRNITVKGKLKGYSYVQVRYSTKKSMKSSKKILRLVKGKGKNKNYTIAKLKKGKTYYVQVRYCSKLSGKYYYGAWSSKKKIKIK